MHKSAQVSRVPGKVRTPVMLQSWCDLTFLHWRLPLDVVAQHVPAPLAVESFDGAAWVAVTPFLLRGLRPLMLPRIPLLSDFPETNCRTYVQGPDGQSGIWFFSLEAASAIAVGGARLTFGLPYMWARMELSVDGNRVRYKSRRRWPDQKGTTDIEVDIGDPVASGDLERFLVERYRLFSRHRGKIVCADVEHPPWRLNRAHVIRAEQTLITAAGLPHPGPVAIAHFSKGVQVKVGAPRRI